MTDFSTAIKWGVTYRDRNSGFEGKAIGVHFYENGCSRVTLIRGTEDGMDVKEFTFDEQVLVDVESNQPVFAVAETGGSRDLIHPGDSLRREPGDRPTGAR